MLFSNSPPLEGYENPELIRAIYEKTVAYRPTPIWNETARSVLDFGGGCGLHYREAGSPHVRWAVVETPAMVEQAKQLSTEALQFFVDIPAAVGWLGRVELVHSNGALQYTPNPLTTLRDLCDLRAEKMLWSRMNLSTSVIERKLQISRLRDNGPGQAAPSTPSKSVRYIETRIPERDFLMAHLDYDLVHRTKRDFCFKLSASPSSNTPA